jgi:two-component system, chemotaxis family, sensor kinase CheA
MDDVINEFLVESFENLDQLDQDLVDLEQDPSNTELLSNVFRIIHTIKGTCGFLGFSRLESLAHGGENLLSRLRDGELALNPEITSGVLAMFDGVRRILSCIEADQNEGEEDFTALKEKLARLTKGESGVGDTAAPAEAPAASPPQEEPAAAQPVEESQPEAPAPTAAAESSEDPEINDEMEAVVNEFLIESYDNLDQIDRDLVDLEQNPSDKELLSSIFRVIHTIKGTCGFLGFSKLESLAHVGENLLSRLREGELVLNPTIASALLKMVDAVRQILGSIESDKNQGSVDYSSLIEVLSKLTKGETVDEVPGASPAFEENSPEKVEVASETSVAPASNEPEAVASVESSAEKKPERRQEGRAGVSESSIRVDVGLLDKLMNLVGELVLARNQIMQHSISNDEAKDSAFVASSQHLNLITTELQEGVMKTRMQPIGNVWSKFPRVVRDLAVACNKKVRIDMEGKETELDKTIIEAIKDPLTHIIRNSVDHGIESPQDRIAKGKDEEGSLMLRAFHEGGQVIIEIVDDGGGIDPERVKKKAIEKHVITSDQASRMGERELINLIFAPGFSTAAAITNVSGRGVGMDVVKTNIEKIGGSVDIHSKFGKGTTLKVKIPLTLAIIPALVVTCGGDRFAIPQVNLLELVRLDQQANRDVEMIHGTPVYRLRGNLLPLVNLNQELGLVTGNENLEDAKIIVVLQVNDRHFGLVVEGIADTEEIVVKPLSKQLKGTNAFAGATIMGDGKVALILDVLGLAQSSRVLSEVAERALSEKSTVETKKSTTMQNLLVFAVGQKGRMAIILDMVGRLEEFKTSEVEKSGSLDVVQYRGEIMPLIYLSQVFNADTYGEDKELMRSVVYSENGRSVGLVVDQILDIVEEDVSIQKGSDRPGVLGTAIIKQRVTDLVDVRDVIQSTIMGYYDSETPALQEG